MDGIELMASAMQVMRERLDVAAGNLANVLTRYRNARGALCAKQR